MLNGLLIVQLLLFCLIFTLIVKVAVIGGAVNGLYFYPKEVQDRVIENGLITEAVERRRKIFMTAFYVVMLVALVLIVRVWNHVTDYWTAYLQSVIFLEVMNWYDGIRDRQDMGRNKQFLENTGNRRSAICSDMGADG